MAPRPPRRGAAAPLERGRRWWCQGKQRRARRAPAPLCLASRALAALAAPLPSPPLPNHRRRHGLGRRLGSPAE